MGDFAGDIPMCPGFKSSPGGNTLYAREITSKDKTLKLH